MRFPFNNNSKKHSLAHKVLLLSVFYFLSFVIFSFIIGGDAISGYSKNGHYFVGYHGKYSEVSEFIWRLNAVHATTAILSVGIILISSIIVDVKEKQNPSSKH